MLSNSRALYTVECGSLNFVAMFVTWFVTVGGNVVCFKENVKGNNFIAFRIFHLTYGIYIPHKLWSQKLRFKVYKTF